MTSAGYAAGAALLMLLGLPACSSSGTPASGAPTPATVVITDEREARLSAALGRHIQVDHSPAVDSLPAALSAAHRALVAAYTEVGIPANIVDPQAGLVAVTEFRVRGAVGGVRASRALSCGRTVTGERADEDSVVLTVVSRLHSMGPTSTRVETRVVATATDTRGTGSRQACTTTGEIESRLHRAARQALAP